MRSALASRKPFVMPLPDFALESYFGVWEFKARYHLAASDAESMALADLLDLAAGDERARWNSLRLGYIESEGMPELRRAIAQTYETIAPQDVVCFAGAEEGLYCAMHAVLRRDDHAIVMVPNYQSTETVPRSLCEVSAVALRPESGWRLDVSEIRAQLRPNTRLIAVNFPNNPTGAIADSGSFLDLIDLCRARGLYLLSDEVYRGVERDPAKRLPQAADRYERALSLNVMSKAYGLPGLRVGWIASRDRDLLSQAIKVKHYLSICNSAPAEVLATIALKAADRVLDRNRRICTENLSKLDAFFERWADRFHWYDPDGGCVAYPAYLSGDVEDFCTRLVEDAGVLLVPASKFASQLCAAPANRFRIGYGRLGIDQALAAFDAFLSRS